VNHIEIGGREVLAIDAGTRDVKNECVWRGEPHAAPRDLFVPATARETHARLFESADVVGILIHTSDFAEGRYLGYSIVTKTEDGNEADDIRTSLINLCRDYGIDHDVVVDRIAMALLDKGLGLLSTKDACAALGMSYAAFIARTHAARVTPAGKTRHGYLWSPEQLTQLQGALPKRPRSSYAIANEGGLARIPKGARVRTFTHTLCFRVMGLHRTWLVPAPNETAALASIARKLGFRGILDAGPAWIAEFTVRLDHATFAARLPAKLEPVPAPGGVRCPWCGGTVHD
jgi:hypothetical protein